MAARHDRLEQVRGELRTVLAGARPRDRVRIARILLTAHTRGGAARHVFGRLPQRDDPPREIAIGGRTVLARRADAVVLYEHFGLDSYGADVASEPVRTIVDLGANVGYATLGLARRYPQARFVCVEPTPRTAELLRANLARNGVRAHVVEAAVVGTPGAYAVRAAAFPAINVVEPERDGPVEGITLAALLERARIDEVDLLKVDIEGAERDLLAAAAEWAPRVRALIAELHPGVAEHTAGQLLAAHGYARVPLPDGTRFRNLVAFRRS